MHKRANEQCHKMGLVGHAHPPRMVSDQGGWGYQSLVGRMASRRLRGPWLQKLNPSPALQGWADAGPTWDAVFQNPEQVQSSICFVHFVVFCAFSAKNNINLLKTNINQSLIAFVDY